MAEGLRTVGVRLTWGDVRGAHQALDDIAKVLTNGHTRYADMNLMEIGACARSAKRLDDEGTHTVFDLANSDVGKLAAKNNIADALSVALSALRRILELESQQAE